MIEILNNIDSQILLFLNGLHTPLLDNFMMMATGRFVWVPMYAAILYILFSTFRRREALVLTVAIIQTIVFADQVCATLLRPQFERLRPANLQNPLSALIHVVNDYRGGSYGFPSCHGSNSFALATILALIVRTRRFTLFILSWALLNSYTRIYLGVHYPGDILTGALIGSAGAAAIYLAASRLFDLRPRYPETHVLFTAPTGPLAPVVGLRVWCFRTADIMPAVAAATVAILLLISLF